MIAIVLGRTCGRRLRRQHVLDFARADAEGQRAEGAVGRGVAVAADDRHSRQRQSLLRTDDVDDPLPGIGQRVEPDAERVAVRVERRELRRRDRVRDRPVDLDRRHVVVGRGDRQVGPPHRPVRHAQAVERLRRGHLVHEVHVDVEQVVLARRRVDQVPLPQLFAQRFRIAVSLTVDCLDATSCSIRRRTMSGLMSIATLPRPGRRSWRSGRPG